MAQLVERLHGMEEVAGSSPAGSTRSEEFGPNEVGVGRASVLISSGPPHFALRASRGAAKERREVRSVLREILMKWSQ